MNKIEEGFYELHLFLADPDDHSIDAFALNRIDRDILSIAKRVSEALDIHVIIEAEALDIGGVRARWKLTKASRERILLWIAILTLIATTYPILRDRGLAPLQKRDLELSIQEHELNIQKLKHEVATLTQEKLDNVRDSAVRILRTEPEIIARRSNIYRALVDLTKVRRISFSGACSSDTMVVEKLVERNDFDRFVVKNEELPKIRDESAVIEVVSPVLRADRRKWRGLYAGEWVEFAMNDRAFMNDVEAGRIGFRSGCRIRCVLESRQWIDEGTFKVSRHSVVLVFSVEDKGVTRETQHGKSYRKSAASAKEQLGFEGFGLGSSS